MAIFYFYIVMIVIVVAVKAGVNAGKGKSGTAAQTAARAKQKPDPSKTPVRKLASAKMTADSVGKITGLVEKMAKRDEEEVTRREQAAAADCDYGDMNHVFSHDDDIRIRQLQDFLKNGIIDKAEYQALLKHYKESATNHGG